MFRILNGSPSHITNVSLLLNRALDETCSDSTLNFGELPTKLPSGSQCCYKAIVRESLLIGHRTFSTKYQTLNQPLVCSIISGSISRNSYNLLFRPLPLQSTIYPLSYKWGIPVKCVLMGFDIWWFMLYHLGPKRAVWKRDCNCHVVHFKILVAYIFTI